MPGKKGVRCWNCKQKKSRSYQLKRQRRLALIRLSVSYPHAVK